MKGIGVLELMNEEVRFKVARVDEETEEGWIFDDCCWV